MTTETSFTEVSSKEELCGYCNLPLVGKARFEGHSQCVRNYRQMVASKMAQEGLVDKDEVEEYLKKNPDGPAVGRDGLTYNQRLAKQEQARKDAENQRIVDRASRRKELSLLEGRLKGLEEQVAADMAEEREEEVRSSGNP
jgi:hypothetical protein